MNPFPEIFQLPLPAGFERVEVYSVAILQSDAPARERERAAVGQLLNKAFGPGSAECLRHHPSGAPYIIRSGATATDKVMNISITHSRDRALLAVAPADVRIGIDAESFGRMRQLERVAPRFLSLAQLEVYAGSLLQAWIFKEAIYKAMLHPGIPLESIPLPAKPLLPGDTALVTSDEEGQFLVALLGSGTDENSAVGLVIKK